VDEENSARGHRSDIFGSACAGTDAGYDVMDDDSDGVVQEEDQPIDNGDGTFALPESWLENMVELEAEPTSDVINKASGTDPRSGTGPSILSKNFLYSLTLPFTASHSGPITSIPYTWNVSPKPAGLEVRVCRVTTSSCSSNLTLQSGTVHTFDNLASNVAFFFTFRVPGTGNLSPTGQGQPDQIIINHN
jgi:hypothetical protein